MLWCAPQARGAVCQSAECNAEERGAGSLGTMALTSGHRVRSDAFKSNICRLTGLALGPQLPPPGRYGVMTIIVQHPVHVRRPHLRFLQTLIVLVEAVKLACEAKEGQQLPRVPGILHDHQIRRPGSGCFVMLPSSAEKSKAADRPLERRGKGPYLCQNEVCIPQHPQRSQGDVLKVSDRGCHYVDACCQAAGCFQRLQHMMSLPGRSLAAI